MPDHLGNSHDGYVFRTDDSLQAERLHAFAAHAEKARRDARCRAAGLQLRDQQGAVGFAAGFAGREEDQWGASRLIPFDLACFRRTCCIQLTQGESQKPCFLYPELG
jgi:hypothetical protein